MFGGALLMAYQTGAELLNYGAFIAFMGVNLASARRSMLVDVYRTAMARVLTTAVPVLGFFICLYIWRSLSTMAKIAGTIWLVLGFLYCAVRTNFSENGWNW